MESTIQKLSSYIRLAWTALSHLVLGGSIAALFFLGEPKKAVQLINTNLFTWRMLRNKGLPMRRIEQYFDLPYDKEITISLTPNYLRGWYSTFNKDRIYLATLSKIIEPKCIFEIGTLRGWSALLFALNAPDDCTVYTLDLPGDEMGTLSNRVLDRSYVVQHNTARTEYAYTKLEKGRQKVQQVYGDSASFDYSQFENSVDIFFLDGAHSYEYVRSDTINALKCVREGGVIAWHDYGRGAINGVSKYLEELREEGKDVIWLPGSSLAILKV